MRRQAFIALGSNIQPRHNLRAALTALAARFTVLGTSAVYQTPPWGLAAQAPFLNAVVQAASSQTPETMLATLHSIEAEQGRERRVVNGPRTLDLDLLLVEDQVIQSARLMLPHPRLHERGFVLVPLCDLASELVHPSLGETMGALLGKVDCEGIERIAPHPDALQPEQDE